MSALRDALQAARKALDNAGLQDGYIDYDEVSRAKALADAALAATAPDNEAAFDALLGDPKAEQAKAASDAELYGAGYLVDGKRVSPESVRLVFKSGFVSDTKLIYK